MAEKKKKGSGEGRKKGSSVPLAPAGEAKATPKIPARLQKKYEEEVVPSLMKKFNYKSKMEVPRLVKVVLNSAVKEAVGNPKVLDSAMDEMMVVSGQKPILTRAKKSIATFKVREGIPLGVRVTLRRARMFEFLDRLVNVALPRVRDFKGISPKAFDGRGNYSLGIKEQIIFPEINYDKIDSVRGLTVTVVTTAKDNEQAKELLTQLGLPFRQ